MDMSVKPCEDFYQYSCGGFVKRNYIPDEDNALNSFNFVGKEVQNRLRGLLEDNDLRRNHSKVDTKFYQRGACIGVNERFVFYWYDYIDFI